MKWEFFRDFYLEDMYYLWNNWIPRTNKKNHKEEVFSVLNKENDDIIDYVDDGFSVTSFRDFMYFAYENTIP